MSKLRYDRESRDRIKGRAAVLRKQTTGAEYWLHATLKKNGEKKILRSFVVGRMIIDIALPFRNLLIEVDGKYHESQKDRDNRRDGFLSTFGFNILRITNEEIFASPQEAVGKILKFPVDEENRGKFYMARRAAKRRSYWVEDNATV